MSFEPSCGARLKLECRLDGDYAGVRAALTYALEHASTRPSISGLSHALSCHCPACLSLIVSLDTTYVLAAALLRHLSGSDARRSEAAEIKAYRVLVRRRVLVDPVPRADTGCFRLVLITRWGQLRSAMRVRR